MKKVFLFILVLGIFISCKNSMSGKFSLTDGKEPFTLNQNMVSRLAAFAVTGNCKLDEQQVEDNVLSALSALSENGNERAAVTVKDFTLSAPKVATLKTPATFGKTERSANIQDFDDINLYLYSTNEGKGNEGWVLASNDHRVGTIIAVVDGKYSEDDEEENPFMDIIKSGLENHILETIYTWNSLTEDDIARATANESYTTSKSYKYDNWYIEDQHRLQYVDHFAWNQNEPFCKAIRVLKGNNSYVTGCGPTVLAQIFAYYEWPERCSEKQYKELKQKWSPAKYWDGVYDWSEMQFGHNIGNSYNELSDDEKENFDLNAGALLYDIGANCNAVYKVSISSNGQEKGSTSINIDKAKTALTYYGYLSDPVYSYSNYNDFYRKVVESINNRCPLYVRGNAIKKGTEYESGHAWLVCGYARMSCDVMKKSTNTFVARIEDDFFYCNPGWAEKYNGYYLAGIFDFSLGDCIVDLMELSSAEGDWYIRKKIEQHERSVVTEGKNKYYQYRIKMIPNIRPEDY